MRWYQWGKNYVFLTMFCVPTSGLQDSIRLWDTFRQNVCFAHHGTSKFFSSDNVLSLAPRYFI